LHYFWEIMKRNYSMVTVLALGAISASANAQVNFASNFDPSTYSVGGLVGQDGWVSGSGTSNLPQVTNNAWFSPSQSLLMTGNPGTGSTFNSNGHAFAAGAPSANTMILTASAKIFVSSLAANADRYFGIGFGTASSATSGFLGVALGGNGLRGGGGSYSSYNSFAGGLLQSRTVNDFLGRWVTMSLTADRSVATNNVVFTFSGLDTTGGLATETFTKSVNFGTTNLAFVQVFSDWGSSSGANGSALLDDVSFGANPVNAVPEPASMAVLGLGAAALLRRRKNKRS
jgi:PEP-CTERM motif